MMADDWNPGFFNQPSVPLAQSGIRIEHPLPRVTDAKSYADVPGGAEYIDPQGQQRKKDWLVKSQADYQDVPEGAEYLDPKGVRRTKTKYEGVSFTAQTLYDMTATDSERFNVLAKTYGKDNVKKDPLLNEWYAEVDGRKLKPGSGDKVARFGAGIAAGAVPTAGAIGGGIGGAAAGAAAGGVGAIPGAAAGAAGGSAVGQGFNDLMLRLAGIYDRSPGQEALQIGESAAMGAAGEGIGRVATAAAPAVKGAIQKGSEALPSFLAKYTGAAEVPDAAERAARLAGQGVKVPPSAWMPEAPYLKKTVEEFDPAFRQQNVLEESAKQHYETEGGRILGDLGVPAGKRPSLTGATEEPSSLDAGKALQERYQGKMAEEDARLLKAVEDTKTAAAQRAGINPAMAEEERKAAVAKLEQSAAQNRTTAQEIIDHGFTDLQADVQKTITEFKRGGGRTGDMTRAMADKIKALNAAVKARAKVVYDAADAAAGDERPNVGNLRQDAKDFLDQLPKPFRDKYPDVVKEIEDLKDGDATFGRMRRVRSVLRSGFDYTDLTPGMREGTFKYFSRAVDGVLHDSAASPGLQRAAKILDTADAFYAKNIPQFHDATIQGISDMMRAGMPVDAETLAGTIFRTGENGKVNTELVNRVRKIAGPSLWGGVQAADTQAMLNQARTLAPGRYDGMSFAKNVIDRVRSGVMDAGYGKETAARLETQARRIMMMEGKLPISAAPGDTVATILGRAEEAAKAAKDLAEADPLGTLSREMKEIDKQFAEEQRALGKQRIRDPLQFLGKTTVGGIEAANRIIAKPDLMIAAGARFGEQSPEFTMLRQVAAQRMLQRSIGQAGTLGKEFSEMTPEVQALLFPGVTKDDAITLAKDMEFLLANRGAQDAGGSMAAASRVLHPMGSIPAVGGLLKSTSLPGVDALGRTMLGKYYAFLSWGTTHPAFVQYVARGVRSANPAVRDMAREEFQNSMMQWGGAIGAGGAEGLEQQGQGEPPPMRRSVR